MSNKIYPIGIQHFEKIRKDGYFYIDKTAWVYQLAKTGSYYLLSSPRRFGTHPLISTLEAYFRGKKELFKGLAIEKLEKDWTEHPILHLDLNIERYDTPKVWVIYWRRTFPNGKNFMAPMFPNVHTLCALPESSSVLASRQGSVW